MDIATFGLERWFAEHEPSADIMLAESGVRSLPASAFDLGPGDLGYVIPTDGDPAIRAKIADRYDRSADEVICTVGAQEANLLAFLSVLGEGDHAVVVTPTYQALHAIPEAFASVTRVGLDPPDWALDPDEVADAIRPATELVVLNNPNNPTGRYHGWDTVKAIYDIAVDAGAYLLCDEVYRLLADDPHPPVATLRRGLSSSSLTKAYGLAGIRFGWLAGPPSPIDAAREWKDYTTISPTRIGQHVARQALEREGELLAASRELADRNRDRVAAFLDEYGLDWFTPVGVNGFVTIPPGFVTAEAFCREFVEAESVVLAPGSVFGYDGYFRIGFGLESTTLETGLDRLGRFLDRRA